MTHGHDGFEHIVFSFLWGSERERQHEAGWPSGGEELGARLTGLLRQSEDLEFHAVFERGNKITFMETAGNVIREGRLV